MSVVAQTKMKSIFYWSVVNVQSEYVAIQSIFNFSFLCSFSCKYSFVIDKSVILSNVVINRCIRLVMVCPKYLRAVGLAGHVGRAQKIL